MIVDIESEGAMNVWTNENSLFTVGSEYEWSISYWMDEGEWFTLYFLKKAFKQKAMLIVFLDCDKNWFKYALLIRCYI